MKINAFAFVESLSSSSSASPSSGCLLSEYFRTVNSSTTFRHAITTFLVQNVLLFQAVTSYLAPPVCAVYVLAMFVERTNELGAFYGLMLGLVIGMTRFILQIASGTPYCDEKDTRTPWLTRVRR